MISASEDSVSPLVLVVEPIETAAFAISRYIATQGGRARCARTGGEAMQEASAQVPDMVLFRLQMADLDPFLFVNRMRQIAPGAALVMMSGTRVPEVARALRVTGIVTKPPDYTELHKTLKLLGRSGNWSEPVATHKPSLLVVDDESHVLESVSDTLRRAPYEVTSTTSPVDALALIRATDVEILLTDERMPRMTGTKLARLATVDKPGLIVIMLSGTLSAESMVEALKAGVFEFLLKPAGAEDLQAALRRAAMVIERRRLFKDLVSTQGRNERSKKHLSAQADSLRRARAIADAENEAKDRFLSHVSHEIRTPLNGIMGVADLLDDAELDPLRRKYVDVIRRSASSLRGLLTNLLDFTKIESDGLELLESDFDLPRLLQDIVLLWSPDAKERRLSLHYTMDPDVPVRVRADSGRVQQILTNLVHNGLKFTKEGGVTLSAELGHSAAGNATLVLSVADTGLGISEEDQELVFHSFSQTAEGARSEHTGIGLGLAISRRLASKLGGSIVVASELGVGSVFRLQIPLKVPAEPAIENDHAAAPAQPFVALSQTPLRVLIAEDNPVNAMVAQAIVKMLGFESDVVTDGKAAVRAMQSAHYDLVLMDCQMPVMDGYAAARSLRKLAGASGRVPIVALTANADLEVRSRCIRAGMNERVVKPFTVDELKEVLSKLDLLVG